MRFWRRPGDHERCDKAPAPAGPYIAGASAEQLQQRGLGSWLRDQFAHAVSNGPNRISPADLPNPQRINAQPIDPATGIVPSSTGSPMLPGRIVPTDGEPGARTAQTFDL